MSIYLSHNGTFVNGTPVNRSEVTCTCLAVHPQTGDECTLPDKHNVANDAQVKQHVTAGGYKWPDLHILDPNEGFNGRQPHRL